MNDLHELNGLKNIYLYDSYLPNNSTKIELGEGNSNLTGANGAGKTSTLNLIPIFYGARPDRLMDRSANKLNFTDYYLPHARSMIVFEYNTPMGLTRQETLRDARAGTTAPQDLPHSRR